MFLTEYDQEKVLEQERRDSMKQGFEAASKLTAKKMLIGGETLEKIAEYSRLSEESILKLARSLGVSVK